MTLRWVRDARPTWDDDRQRVVGGAPAGALDVTAAAGEGLPGDWWSARDDDGVVGYGWLDSTWGGDAEILLAVAPDAQGRGVGSFVLGHLEAEAATRGLNYVYNTVRPTHPERDAVHAWLVARGYAGDDADPALRKRVGTAASVRPAPAHGGSAARPAPSRSASGGASTSGQEDGGGYVDVEDHRY